jgi:pilus assembly protein CpaD
MYNRIIPSLCVCFGLALAGCDDTRVNTSYDGSHKALKIDYVQLKHPTAFVPGTARLANGESEKLTAFLNDAQVSAEDHVYFATESGDKLAAQRIGQVVHQLSARGIGATNLPGGKDVQPNELVVVVERYVVTPPQCPDWTKDPVANHENEVASNFGCTDASNLGLMVADPRDLVIGRQMGPQQGDPAIAGVARYRAGTIKPVYQSTNNGGGIGGGGGGGGGGMAPAAIGGTGQ